MDTKEILLVEDNPNDVELTLRAFRKNHLINSITVVNDGEAALDYLFCRNEFANRTKSPLPTIVLLDLKLPKLSGLEVLKEIRANKTTSILPVVILTSSNEEQDLVQSYRNGANSYIRKPVEFNKFIHAVQQLGLYWLLLNETPLLMR